MAKEGLFNILVHRIDLTNCSVLDLFAGTGNIGLEFLSRGAQELTFVDNHFKCVSFIRRTCEMLGVSEATVKKMNANQFIQSSSDEYELIFLDPPYEFQGIEETVRALLTRPLLMEDGILVLEHRKGYDFSGIAGYEETRVYGDSGFSFFSR